MTRLTDERLAEIKTMYVHQPQTAGVLSQTAVVLELIAEVERTRSFEQENDELWADLTRAHREIERHPAKYAELHRLALAIEAVLEGELATSPPPTCPATTDGAAA